MAPIGSQRGARILVTGATGFVGRALCTRLATLGYTVRRAIRVPLPPVEPDPFDTVTTGELGPQTDWSNAVRDVSIIFHLAARTHVLRETASDALAEYRRINVDGTRTLARTALNAGVRRIIFLSSIKVTGESTVAAPYTEDTAPQPKDAYGISKWEAEQVLSTLVRDTNLESVILRPPLVYGPGVKGNFLRLMHWVHRGVPLPLASITNRRSLIYLENLVDALVTAGLSPKAAHKTYLISDAPDMSTPGLIRSIAQAIHVSPRLFACPPIMLAAGATLFGKRDEFRRLAGSLQIDSTRFRNELRWAPPFQLTEGLARTAQWYYSQFPVKSNT